MKSPEILDYQSSQNPKPIEIQLRDWVWKLMLYQAIGGFVAFALLDLARQKFVSVRGNDVTLLLGGWLAVYIACFSIATRNRKRFALGWILTFSGAAILCLFEMILVAYFLCAPLDRFIVGYR